MIAVSVALGAGPSGAQTRTHMGRRLLPTPAPAAAPAPAAKPPTTATPPVKPATLAPTPPAPSPAPVNAVKPSPPAAPPAPAVAAVTSASGSLRGLLIGPDAHAGTITVGRPAFPPVVLQVSKAAVISRDGAPARLEALETGSRTAIPDAVLVTGSVAADGSPVATRIKATSLDHYWYGHLTGIDTASDTITVTRSDGQRRAFHLASRTNLIQFGAGNVEWSALRVGSLVEVVWLPGDSDSSATLLEAHMVILNKPYEGVLQRPPAGR